jgi:hypothetical protein
MLKLSHHQDVRHWVPTSKMLKLSKHGNRVRPCLQADDSEAGRAHTALIVTTYPRWILSSSISILSS